MGWGETHSKSVRIVEPLNLGGVVSGGNQGRGSLSPETV